MPNATQRVPSSVVEYSDHRIYRQPVATPQTWFGGAMVTINPATSLAYKAINTATYIFDGILEQTVRIVINSDDTDATLALDQSKKLPVLRPFRFRMYIAAATAADFNKLVYPAFDNEVTLTAGAGAVKVGRIDQIISGTEVLIWPSYNGGV